MTNGEKKDERMRAEEKYKALVETAADAIFTLDLLGRLTFVNPAAERISGYSEEELVGRHFRDLLPAKDIPACLNVFQKAMRGQPTPPIKIEMITKEGGRVPLELLGSPVKRGRRIVEILGIVRDITERKRAEEALRIRQSAIASSINAIALADLEGNLTYVNPSFLKLWGYDDEKEVLRKPAVEFWQIKEKASEVVEALRDRGSWIGELVATRKGGSLFDVQLSASMITDEAGNPIRMMASFIDITERKRAEEALRKSEERYKKQFEVAMDAILIADAETGILVDCNRVALELVGREKSELVGKHQRILHPPEEIEGEFSRTFKQHLKEKEGQVLETQVITKKGEIKDIAIKASTFELEGQKMILGIFRDITERKRAEEEIRTLSQFLDSVIDNANVWLNVLDEKANVVIWNRAAEEISGYSREEVVGHDKIWEWLYPDEEYRNEVFAQAVAIIERGGEERDAETTIQCKDGQTRIISWNSRRLVDEKGNSTGSIAIGRDITERKRAEETLRESEEKYRTILDNIEDGYFEVDIAGNFTFFNDSMCGIIGYPRDEMMGMNNRQYMDKENAKKVLQAFNQVYTTGKPTKGFSWEIIRKDGTRRFIEASVSLTRNSEGEPIGFRGIVRDITERKRAEEEVRRRSEELAALYDVSLDVAGQLDLNTLLETILLRAMELLRANAGGGLYLYDPESQELELMVHQALKKDLTGIRLALGEGMCGKLAQTGEPLVVTDYANWEGRSPHFADESTFNALAVPIKRGDTLLGALYVNDPDLERRFEEGDLRLATLFANQAVTAIENARLYEETQKRLAETTVLHEVSEIINATLDLKEVFQRVVEELSKAFGYRLVDIYLLEEDGLRLQASVGYDAEITIELIPLERGVVGRVARTGQPAFIPDVRQDPDYIGSYPDITSEICVSVKSAETLLGTLNVESDAKRPLTDDDLHLLSTLSSHIGVAIENARLYEEEQRHSAQRRTIAEVGRTAASILEMDTLLAQVVGLIAQSFRYYRVHVFQVDQDSGYAVHKAATGVAAATIAEEGLRLKIGEEGLVGWVAQHGEPLLVNDVSQDPRYYAHPNLPDTRSELDVPIRAGEKVIGILDVQSTELDAFDEGDLETLQTLADQLAVAMENARLYEATQQLATTDGLTGLYNLRYFYETLEKEIQRSKRYDRSVSLIILDIDDFKAYNDRYGHPAGDDLLRELAQLMSKVTRQTDTLVRYGGEEFTVILPETETEGADFLAERLLEEVREHRFSMEDGQTIGRITISLGVATYPHHADSAKALVDAADKELLRAKQVGKNQLSVCGEELIELKPR
ncbi:MAG: PAS domain S-box protein [Anaerolineae bacterium]